MAVCLSDQILPRYNGRAEFGGVIWTLRNIPVVVAERPGGGIDLCQKGTFCGSGCGTEAKTRLQIRENLENIMAQWVCQFMSTLDSALGYERHSWKAIFQPKIEVDKFLSIFK